jgi:hypothetical protein
MIRPLVFAWLVALCAAPACLDISDDPDRDDVAEREAGGIVCFAYPCCGDLVCDKGETCLLCPVDCGCVNGEICVAGVSITPDSEPPTPPDPGLAAAGAVCVPDSGGQPKDCGTGQCEP